MEGFFFSKYLEVLSIQGMFSEILMIQIPRKTVRSFVLQRFLVVLYSTYAPTTRSAMAHMGWPWPVFRLKRTKFRFVIRAKKAKISLLISFCKKKIRTFRIV